MIKIRLFINKEIILEIFEKCEKYLTKNNVRALEFLTKLTNFINEAEEIQEINKDMFLRLKQSSWENLFKVIYNLKNPIEKRDNSSIGNFWASIQSIEDQYRKETKFEESFFEIKK